MTALLLLARGACAGLALFGAAVLVLGGASLRLLLAFWALGALTVLLTSPWLARLCRTTSRRLP